MAKQYKIKITSRNFIFGEVIYGKDSVHVVDEATARYIIKRGKGELVEGELALVEDEFNQNPTATFMAMVKANAHEILQILESAAKNSPEVTDEQEASKTNETEKSETVQTGSPSETTENGSADTTSKSSTEAPKVPDDFPGREILNKAGIEYLHQIPADKESLMALEQMTGRVANQIGIKLAEMEA
jgi:uncharacterized phage infection (PIP) family protein YhgE